MGSIEPVSLFNGLSDAARNIVGIAKRVAGIAEPAVVAELNIQVFDLLDRVRGLQERDSALQQEKAALTQRVAELERENGQLHAFEIEAENYKLEEIAPSALAYVSKVQPRAGEPKAYLCVHCFDRKQKSILQFESYQPSTILLRCPGCGGAVHKKRDEPGSAGVTVVARRKSRLLDDFENGM
jgi:hypothetical protein